METIMHVVVPMLFTSTLPSLFKSFLFFFKVLIDTSYKSVQLIVVELEKVYQTLCLFFRGFCSTLRVSPDSQLPQHGKLVYLNKFL